MKAYPLRLSPPDITTKREERRDPFRGLFENDESDWRQRHDSLETKETKVNWNGMMMKGLNKHFALYFGDRVVEGRTDSDLSQAYPSTCGRGFASC